MKQPRPTGHIFFVILCVLAIPFGTAVGFMTLVLGFDLPDAKDAFDLGPALAMFGSATLFVVAFLMFLVWVAIYHDIPNKAVSYRNWVIAAAALVLVHGSVIHGFVRRNMSNSRGGEVVRGYVDGFWYMLAESDGLFHLLFFWPVVPFIGFLFARQRASASSVSS